MRFVKKLKLKYPSMDKLRNYSRRRSLKISFRGFPTHLNCSCYSFLLKMKSLNSIPCGYHQSKQIWRLVSFILRLILIGSGSFICQADLNLLLIQLLIHFLTVFRNGSYSSNWMGLCMNAIKLISWRQMDSITAMMTRIYPMSFQRNMSRS